MMRVGNVSFINSYPFQYGLDTLADFQISKLVPSAIAQALQDNSIDVGLVPVAAFIQHEEWHLVSDYCIGAVGPVKTVLLVSRMPIGQVKTICYDPDSRSSNMLTKVLCANYWAICPKEGGSGREDARVVIGDKAFLDYSKEFPYCYDLAQVWMDYQQLPFVFAVWASNKVLPQEELAKLNRVLKYGVEHIREAVQAYAPLLNVAPAIATDYLFHNISYPLDDPKRIAIRKFYEISQRAGL